MASIVTGILRSTVGLLLNKIRDKTADKLKDGDTTDSKIRKIIVRELNDVNDKINGLSRSYLLTSYNFLREGVNLLKASLDKSEAKPKAILSKTQNGVDDVETSAKPSDVGSGILTEALTLTQAMGQVKINSDKEFETAKKRFEDARREATRAFCNEALSIKDRIFAAKLRIVSELLECLESPETAITNCLPFLETFHSLPAIREIFLVYINGGFRSMDSKTERVENVKSVMLINYVLFRFVLEFSNKYCSPRTWPTIELGDRSFRPILDWMEVSTKGSWGKEFIQPPNEVDLDEQIGSFCSAVNSDREIISYWSDGNINVASPTGDVKMVKLNYPGDDEVIKRDIRALAVDCNNNIYVVMYLKRRAEGGVVNSFVLYVFNENYNVKQNCPLHFLHVSTDFDAVEIAINKNNNIILSMSSDSHMYVCDLAGKVIHKFKRDTCFLHILTISGQNEIMLTLEDRKAVHRYTEKGDLESTIKVPKSHKIESVAFQHVICKIIVLTYVLKSYSYFLLCYSETGELENSTFLYQGSKIENPQIRSHPSGPVVVVSKRSLTFI